MPEDLTIKDDYARRHCSQLERKIEALEKKVEENHKKDRLLLEKIAQVIGAEVQKEDN